MGRAATPEKVDTCCQSLGLIVESLVESIKWFPPGTSRAPGVLKFEPKSEGN
jgi:hypothetical protein